ncbi:MAG: hypothetical protein P8M63_07195 [Paracoccaceae bacterium]|nr:hypothetical protein [Paracoccaceae bacterium]
MLRTLSLTLCLGLTVAGCARVADSRFNPLNWFGQSSEEQTVAPQDLRPLVPTNRVERVGDARALVAQITALSVERTPSGALIRAKGIAATQGGFNAQLVPTGIENGTATFAFRVEVPAGFQALGSTSSREITVARAISTQELAGIRQIRVQAAQNSRVTRR